MVYTKYIHNLGLKFIIQLIWLEITIDNNLLSMDDLADVFEQLESIPDKEVPLTEEEIASQRRYDEIIKKHKEGQV